MKNDVWGVFFLVDLGAWIIHRWAISDLPRPQYLREDPLTTLQTIMSTKPYYSTKKTTIG